MKYNLAFIILFFTFACNKNPLSIGDKPEPIRVEEVDGLVPLSVGNYWSDVQYTCRNSTCDSIAKNLTDSMTVRVFEKRDIEIDGYIYNAAFTESYSIKYNLVSDYKWLSFNGSDGLYLLGGISNPDSLFKKILQLKYPVSVGESWQVPHLVYDLYENRFLIDDTLTYTCLSTNETIETPAGIFECYVYNYRIRPADDVLDEWDYYLYYKPGIGKVAVIIKSVRADYIIYKILLYDYLIK